VEKEAFESHSQKQGKASTSGSVMAFQSKANLSLAASSTKLASNGKLTNDKHKKCLENNLCLYCSAGDHKLDFYSKKQTPVSFKGHSTSATASEKPSEK